MSGGRGQMAAYRGASVDAAGDTGEGVTPRGTRQRQCGAGEGAVVDCWPLPCVPAGASGTRGRGGAAPRRGEPVILDGSAFPPSRVLLQLPDLCIRLGGGLLS